MPEGCPLTQLTPGRKVRNHWYNPYRSTFNGIQRHKQDNPTCLGPLEKAVGESRSLKLKDTAASRIDNGKAILAQDGVKLPLPLSGTSAIWFLSTNHYLWKLGREVMEPLKQQGNNFRTVSKLVCYSGLVSLLSFLGVFWEAGGGMEFDSAATPILQCWY